MAANLWGKVYHGDRYAGVLEQRPGGGYAFTYDSGYLAADGPAIAHTLPLQEAPHTTEYGLPAFFDNLVAEGWLRNAQARALGVSRDNRFALLLAFGNDCAGAVSVIDPDPEGQLRIDPDDVETVAALSGRASLSGVQAKVPVVMGARGFRHTEARELSTHIAKLPSGELSDIVDLEWLSTAAAAALLPEEPHVEMTRGGVEGVADDALIIKRFDRTPARTRRHFEEFNQLLGHVSEAKYDGSYDVMGRFIRSTPGCVPAEADRLYRRVLACLLLGNTDAHLKNFAMFHTGDGLRLAPVYDMVASAYHRQFQTLALSIAGATDIALGDLQPKHLVDLGPAYDLPDGAIRLAVEDIGRRMPQAKDAVNETTDVHPGMRDKIIELMDKRWNGAFASIGQLLSKRRGTGGKQKGLPKGGSRR
mgnify:CR=1 FL=1